MVAGCLLVLVIVNSFITGALLVRVAQLRREVGACARVAHDALDLAEGLGGES